MEILTLRGGGVEFLYKIEEICYLDSHFPKEIHIFSILKNPYSNVLGENHTIKSDSVYISYRPIGFDG